MYVSWLLLEAGTALPGLELPLILYSTDSPLPVEKTDSPKHKAVLSGAGTFLMGTQSHSQQPFLSLCSRELGGSQLGGSHIEKLGGAWGTLRPWSGIQT